MKTEKLLVIFKDDIWQPSNYTDYYWTQSDYGLRWSIEGNDPEQWDDCYSIDYVPHMKEKSHFVLMEIDDGCGGLYQAIFDKNKEIKNE